MTCQILTVLIVTFMGFFALQVSLLEISSIQYRLRLSSEITKNFEETHNEIINPLKSDSLSITFLSYIEAREQQLTKVADMLAEVLSKKQSQFSVSWQDYAPETATQLSTKSEW